MARQELLLPDLGFPADEPVVATLWLVSPGSYVVEGDPILEVLAGSAVVDLPSPASGTLAETLVEEEDRLSVGQALAIIEPDE